MGADGVAIAFVTPEQGEQLTAIECFINMQLAKYQIDDFEAHTPRVKAEEPEQPKPVVPVFGRRVKRYRRGL